MQQPAQTGLLLKTLLKIIYIAERLIQDISTAGKLAGDDRSRGWKHIRLSGNDARNGENPHEYRLFCPSILLLILD